MNLARHRILSITTVFLLSGALLLGRGSITRGQAAGSNPPPTKLAVVNIVDLFESLNEKLAADSDLQKMKNGFSDDAQKMQKDLDDLQKAVDSPAFKKDSTEYKTQLDDLLKKGMEIQAFGQYAQNKLFIETRIRTASLYNKINDAVAAYSQANGIALVFVADNINVDNAKSQEMLQAMVTNRKLLYAHPSFDITRAIRDKMNAEYGAGPHK